VKAPLTTEPAEADVARFALLASAISRRPLRVEAGEAGEPAWTDGKVVFLDVHASARAQIESVVVQASLLAAGSLDREIVRGLSRNPTLARRYLAIEGQRALSTVEPLLPPAAQPLIHPEVIASIDSAAGSLAAAQSNRTLADPPASFGTIRAKSLLSSPHSAERAQAASHAAGTKRSQKLADLPEDAEADAATEERFSGSVGGGAAVGRWLAKLFKPVRQLRGGGTPGADATTHWSRTGKRRGSRAVLSTAAIGSAEEAPAESREKGIKYPEWDAHGRCYRNDWCTVYEAESEPKTSAVSFTVPNRAALRRSLARLGLGIDRYRRQEQGDDIDIDAVIDQRVNRMTGSSCPEAAFIKSVRRRRDLSVLLLLDISGSAAEPAADGKTVHEHQRAAAATLALALHELGDRVALYAYHSRGRSAVTVLPVKRFGEDSRALMTQRLGGLEPAAYSRLGTAIRHGTAILQDEGGTPRRLLVVLSDGLAYDHGYEPAYGAADSRRALGEARRQGIGCLCLSVGASTDDEALGRVFGTSALATLPAPEQLSQVIGPLFRAALRSADVRRRSAGGVR
jgi:nitric oxide reductase NorD protein